MLSPMLAENVCPLPAPGVPLDRWPALTLLAGLVWSEARNQPAEAQLAVAFTPINRVQAHQSWPGKLVDVILEPKQFTGITDNRMAAPLTHDSADAWFNAFRAASAAFFGLLPQPFKLPVTHFYSIDVSPEWAPKLTALGQIGQMRFLHGR
jgi:spore germination cell wall hydrolase CwlJ-like protein